jgi:phosphoribosylformylglycinamidine synthase
MGLTDEEYNLVCTKIGKHPNFLEVAMFSVMWSEHCSYKNSRKVLKLLPTKGDCVLQGPGENAGIVDVGDGLAVAFKIESHNHPSAVEPYQGAATGAGGIIRDIFTMGARPIAMLDPLFFGPTDDARNRHIIDGVVAGIAGYGNAVGIPTVGGMSWFGSCYSVNPLINVMCVGYLKHDDIRRGKATGAGNKVMLIGSTTGRDGIHGATFASADLTEEAQERKSAVQVGDPFREKLLLEACLELVEKELVLGIQDLGAAGLTCATSEMASRGGSGMKVELDLVPKRETGMSPYEIMLSESQERMLMVPVPGKEGEVADILRKWDLDAAVIGEVTDGGMLTLSMHGEVVADIPAAQLAEDAPAYDREYVKPGYINELGAFDPGSLPAPDDEKISSMIIEFMSSPALCSKRWIYSQYDHQVGCGTAIKPGGDAAVVRIPGTDKGIALTTDVNPRYCYLFPREGAKLAVAEAARKIALTGATPLAVTNCQNHGNPMKPEVYWSFRESVLGLAEGCEAFGTPVTGGNVSFYNEDGETAIYPTPTIGMVGSLDDVNKAVPAGFREAGNSIVLLGETKDELGGSEYLAHFHGIEAGRPPRFNADNEKRLIKFLIEAAGQGLMASAHDCAEGGLGAALSEACLAKGIGADVDLTDANPDCLPLYKLLFSESASRALIEVKPGNAATIQSIARRNGVPAYFIGKTGGETLSIKLDGKAVDIDLCKMNRAYEEALPCAISGR